MQTVGVLIRHRRNQLGLTLQQVADVAECTKSYLSTIENDRRAHPPSEELLARLERALHLDQGHLVDVGRWSRTPSSVRRHVQTAQLQHARARRLIDLLRDRGSDLDTLHSSGELAILVDEFDSNVELSEPILEQVPLINNVAAGYPVEFTDLDYPARAADEYITCPGVADPQAFAARVIGDSMLPAYREGDIVIFSPEKPTPPGCDCFVRLQLDHETTFKRIYFEPDADGEADLMIRLQPLNPAYPPRTLHREQIGGLYAAAFVMRPIG